MLRKWIVVPIAVGFLLAIVGLFTAPDGAIGSVHSFAQLVLEPWFATFFFTATGITVFLVGSRLRDVVTAATLQRAVSRETARLYVGRNRRRYGGYVAHAGIVMLFAASVGMIDPACPAIFPLGHEHGVFVQYGEIALIAECAQCLPLVV